MTHLATAQPSHGRTSPSSCIAALVSTRMQIQAAAVYSKISQNTSGSLTYSPSWTRVQCAMSVTDTAAHEQGRARDGARRGAVGLQHLEALASRLIEPRPGDVAAGAVQLGLGHLQSRDRLSIAGRRSGAVPSTLSKDSIAHQQSFAGHHCKAAEWQTLRAVSC